MTAQSGSNPSPAARSFAEHVRSFHASLPGDEQKLLEQVFALAEQAAANGTGDVQGYAVDAFIWFEDRGKKMAPSSALWKTLGQPPLGGVGPVPMP